MEEDPYNYPEVEKKEEVEEDVTTNEKIESENGKSSIGNLIDKILDSAEMKSVDSKDECTDSKDKCTDSENECVDSENECVDSECVDSECVDSECVDSECVDSECTDSKDECTDSKDKCVDSKDECTDSENTCTDSKDECTDSKDKCVDSENECTDSEKPKPIDLLSLFFGNANKESKNREENQKADVSSSSTGERETKNNDLGVFSSLLSGTSGQNQSSSDIKELIGLEVVKGLFNYLNKPGSDSPSRDSFHDHSSPSRDHSSPSRDHSSPSRDSFHESAPPKQRKKRSKKKSKRSDPNLVIEHRITFA